MGPRVLSSGPDGCQFLSQITCPCKCKECFGFLRLFSTEQDQCLCAHALVNPVGCWWGVCVCAVSGYLGKLLGRRAEGGFPACSLLHANNRCARFYPWINARLLVPLSLMLIPTLGFILQPRWFQGVSCRPVNPCPALSCMNLPGWPGCGGNLLHVPSKPLQEVPGCSLLPALGREQGHRPGSGGNVV